MSTIIKSNKAYTGNKVLPNVIDFITTTSDRKSYLTDIYSTVNNDVSYITDANADNIFSKLKTHRQRVINDGGIVPSLAQTLRALIFSISNNLTSEKFTAASADFGIKIVGNAITKVYDISGRDLEIFGGSFTRANVGNLSNLTANITSTLMYKVAKFSLSEGVIIGSSSDDILSDTTSNIRSPLIFSNSAATGAALVSIENNNGNVARLSYTLSSGTATQLTSSQSGGNYKKYAGLVGLSIPNGASYLYENGVQKSVSQTPSKALAAVDAYLALQIASAGSMLNESWVINSASIDLAIALSDHLNKAIFV